MSTNVQFNRAANLFVANQTEALDLSSLRFKFKVSNADNETPNIAEIRVYNLSADTTKRAIKEYDSVVLQAGYGDRIGIIFKGTIKQFRRGKESNIDSYLDILAADGDLPYNYGFVNQTLKAGSTAQERLTATAKSMGVDLDPNAVAPVAGGVLPRGKVFFNLGRAIAADIAATAGARWSIQQGKLVMIPLTGYLPGEVVQINSLTGMIGVPEATDNGIQLTTLLNPLIKIGNRIQINNKDISLTIVREQFFPQYRAEPTMIADVTNDGIYRVLVCEHSGDTRGQEWYSEITCLSLDPSATPINSVKAFG